ncbi:MAG: signal peptidase I [Candidatus Aenigmatarchaeota archaeon]
MKSGEEAFRPKAGSDRRPASFMRRIRKSGVFSTLFYMFLGVGMALVVKQGLAFGLTTDMPVVAVISASMQHDHASQTHYQWLRDNLGYDEGYVDSWPMPTGFLVGDMPIVQGSGSYAVGDVIVYSVPGSDVPIIHRIVKINADGTYQTKGDNNLQQLPYEFSVREDQIHGRVVALIPKLGYFKVFTTRAFGLS